MQEGVEGVVIDVSEVVKVRHVTVELSVPLQSGTLQTKGEGKGNRKKGEGLE